MINYIDWIYITRLCEVMTAIGTVSCAVAAAYLGYKDRRLEMAVYSTVGVIMPDNTQHLMVGCTNTGRTPIYVTGLSFNPNIYLKKPLRVMPIQRMEHSRGVELPRLLQFSENITISYEPSFFSDPAIKSILSKYKVLARFQLKYLWRVVATTNIREFNGKLTDSLVDKIIDAHF